MTIITPALENYLESIFIVQKEKTVVRVKDIAEFIKVKAPSVIVAISNLKERGLVHQEPYGHIELTSEGYMVAREIYERHRVLKKFFNEILGLNEAFAEKEACEIEHYLSKESFNRIINFIQFIESDTRDNHNWLKKFREFINKKKSSAPVPEPSQKDKEPTLADVEVGQPVRIKKINATGLLKRKLMDMGFVRDETIKIERRAPLGYPIDVLVKGSHISLRKEEAKIIMVEI